MRRKFTTTVYLFPEQDQALKSLSERTRVVVAEYIREGVDLVLAKYEQEAVAKVLPRRPWCGQAAARRRL